MSHADIQCWLTGFDLAPASVGKTHRVLSMLLTYAVKDGRLVVKSRRRRKSARVHDVEKRFLSHLQVRELADACGDESGSWSSSWPTPGSGGVR